jgi:predicted nucleotidyltransferase
LCGYPALDVRGLLRRAPEDISVDLVRQEMKIAARPAEELIASLQRSGFIEVQPRDKGRWRTTVKGNAFIMASAAAPMKRSAADEVLLGFLARVEQVRDEPHWCFKVDRAVVFGSYLGDATTLGDVDVGIRLREAHRNRETQKQLEEQCRRRADDSGRRFPHFVARLTWPEIEVRQFLKSRTRVSLHDLTNDGPVIDAGPHTTIFAKENICREALPLLATWNQQTSRAVLETINGRKKQQAEMRQLSAARRGKKEQEEILAKLRTFQEMSPERLAEHRDEIGMLLAQVKATHARRRSTRSDSHG